MPLRLTPLDSSFLRLETPNAHMHVAWVGLFTPSGGRRPTLAALRAAIAGRLQHAQLFRCRLAFPSLGLGEPCWVDDPDFALTRHVSLLASERLSDSRFRQLADTALSEPLDRSRPLWHVYLAPRLADGRVGVVCKMHHAMVDGKSAVEVGTLLFDLSPDATPEAPDEWSPAPVPGAARLALGAVENGAIESFRALRGMGRLAASPRGAAGRVAGTLRRAALGAEDVLRPAPAALVNSQIGPRRTLVRYATRMERLKAVKRAAGVTLNDVCLAAVAGAMRELALERRVKPAPLKVMVPVSVRQEDERLELGNRISFAFIDLPVHRFSARQRLAEINRQTSEFKRAGRPEGVTAVMNAVGLLPAPLKGPVARAAGSARVYNLTVSNIPGPGFPLYMLGAQLDEAYPIVPLSEGHALSIGIFSYRDDVFFGIHAEPFALPEARLLPEALDAAIVALGESAGGVAARRRTALRLLPATANGGGP